ncbi:hypothetical protein [Tomitella cavernea]|uniref:hypothetical protein n=1 Tax=Tomitella cavernea TaxID=1387982 RepID=UPI0019058F7C|nr:hypothetical protein [Tomitella cavernea]
MLQILGTVMTSVGLLIAWWHLDSTQRSAQAMFAGAMMRLRRALGIKKSVSVQVPAAFGSAGMLSAEVSASIAYDPGKPAQGQIESLFRECEILRKEICDVRKEAATHREQSHEREQKLDEQLRSAISDSEQRAERRQFAYWGCVLAGVLMSMAGIVLGMCAAI